MEILKTTKDQITYFTLKNSAGAKLTVVDYGARLISFKVPVKGNLQEVVVSGKTLGDFKADSRYFGATVGPVAGRITKGAFTLEGKTYQLVQNEKGNTLHSGVPSYESTIFSAKEEIGEDYAKVTFSHTQKDGHNGFPGNVEVTVAYTLYADNRYAITFTGKTDKLTVFNPTNHGYYNLTGKAEDVSQHTLKISASHLAELQENSLPTGTLLPMEGRGFDLREGKKIGDVFASGDEQIAMKKGIDHPFVLENEHQVVLTSPDEKLTLKVTTDRDSVVIFTANFGNPINFEKGSVAFHGAVAIEPQNLPDAMNHPGFGNVVLKPEETYHAETIYEVLVKD